MGIKKENFFCPVCLDLMQEPVTIPCGHSYCGTCISRCWDGAESRDVYSCPQCRQRFTPRPVLKKNTMLTDLMDQIQEVSIAAAKDMACDVCTGMKAKVQERQAYIHKDILKNIQDTEKELQLLEKQLNDIQLSAELTVHHGKQVISDLIHELQRRRSKLDHEVRLKQQTEESMMQAIQKKLKQKISKLKKTHTELQQIDTTEGHIQFILSYSSLSHSSIAHTRPQSFFLEFTEDLHTILMEDCTKVCERLQRDTTIKTEFLQYSQEITLDPNTAHQRLGLSEENRKVSKSPTEQGYPHHQDRFIKWHQVLSRESLNVRCYWEVDVRGKGLGVGVVYKSIRRAGEIDKCVFGINDKSWMLWADDPYTFMHNDNCTTVLGPASSRIGVYVDQTAATLSFYSVQDTMTLLHTVNTTFTEPLHVAVRLDNFCKIGTSAEIYKL